MDLQLTPAAVKQIANLAERESISFTDEKLRIKIVPGGCSGLTWDLGWDSAVAENDETGEFDGVKIILDLNSYLYLEGSTLDFSAGLQGQGFHFHNPNALRTCACGESFTL